MYSIVMAMALVPGSAAPAGDINDDIRDLKRSVAALREEQTQARVDELKLVIAGLRQRITDDKLDELRRDLIALRHEDAMLHAAVMVHMPPHHAIDRATIAVEVPADATFIVNDKEVPVPAVSPVFVSPPLQPGKDYFYDCKVTVKRDGKTVTKIKRVKVCAGETVHVNYQEMESR
jgi:uncharacterized protein (TIGR03000 family)